MDPADREAMSLILPKRSGLGELWLGAERAARDLSLLRSKNIRTLITITQQNTIKLPDNDSITQIFFEATDSQNVDIAVYFEQACTAIENARRKKAGVLVHCKAGVSRSATLVIAYLMKVQGWNYEKALLHVKEKRPFISPNLGFRSQLIQYYFQLEKQKKTKHEAELLKQKRKEEESKSQQDEDPDDRLDQAFKMAIRQHYRKDSMDRITQPYIPSTNIKPKKFAINYDSIYNNAKKDLSTESMLTPRNQQEIECVQPKQRRLRKHYNLLNLYNFKKT